MSEYLTQEKVLKRTFSGVLWSMFQEYGVPGPLTWAVHIRPVSALRFAWPAVSQACFSVESWTPPKLLFVFDSVRNFLGTANALWQSVFGDLRLRS